MNNRNLKSVGVGALALMMSVSMSVPVFAQSRFDQRDNNRDNHDYRNNNQSSNRSYRENERITAQGKISSFTKERDGYRVQLDRGRESYWVPQSYFRNRGHNIGVGISVVFGGVWRGNSVYVDDVNWQDGGYYNQQLVRGVVEGIDYRAGTVFVRDDLSRRTVTVDLRGNQERRLRRGDFVELSGRWDRGGVFEAYRIDRVR